MAQPTREQPPTLAEQIAAAEKTLLALESLVRQTQEMITVTRRMIEDAKENAGPARAKRTKAKSRR